MIPSGGGVVTSGAFAGWPVNYPVKQSLQRKFHVPDVYVKELSVTDFNLCPWSLLWVL